MTPSPKQTLVLWALLVRGGELPQKDLRAPLDKKDRDGLVAQGLLAARKGPRNSVLLELTDRGWVWAAQNFAAPLPRQGSAGLAILAEFLGRLGTFLAAHGVPLADFIGATAPAAAVAEAPAAAAPPAPVGALPDRIRAAYLAASGGEVRKQVRLAALRPALAQHARAEVDAALLDMEQAGVAGLWPLDDPTQIGAADSEAAVSVGGRPRHLLWLDR